MSLALGEVGFRELRTPPKLRAVGIEKIIKEKAWHCQKLCVYSYMRYGENMKNLVENAFGDIVERTDYGNHKNQLNLFDNLNDIVEENTTADDILDFLFCKNRKGVK